MSYDYTDQYSDVSASWAWNSTTWTPHDFRNYLESGRVVSGEAFTVPASSPYKVTLDFRPKHIPLTIVVNSVTMDVVPASETPSATQVAVEMESGILTFHSSQAGLAGTADYTGYGTVHNSHLMNVLGKEIKSVQDWLDASLITAIEDNLTGVDGVSFTLDKDNASTGVDQWFAFNRGSSGDDVYLYWDESEAEIQFKDSGSVYQDLKIANLDVGGSVLLSATATAPANGVFLQAANALGFSTNSAEKWRISSAGQLTGIAAGSDISVNGMLIGDNPREIMFDPGGEDATLIFDTGDTTFDFTHEVTAPSLDITGAIALGGTLTGMTNTTGSGNLVLATSPTLTTPNIGAATGSSVDVSGDVTSTRYVNDQAANQGFEVKARDTPSLAAPYFRATASNAVTALDVMPNGSPSDSAGNGVAWIDVVDADVSSTNPSLAAARLGIFASSPSNYAYTGSINLNGHAAIPFHLTVGGTDVAICKTDLDFDVQAGLIVGDEIDCNGTGDSTFAASLDIEGGISMGASAPATAEGILYIYRDAGDPFIILGSSSTEYCRFRGQAQDQLDIQKNGGTTSIEMRLGADLSLTMNEATTTPPSPTSSAQGRIYFKGDKLVIQWNDAGTVRYKYLDLTGTGVTWVHTTTAP